MHLQGRAKKTVPARFSEENSIWADGLCIGIGLPRSVGSRKEGKFRNAGMLLHDPALSGTMSCLHCLQGG